MKALSDRAEAIKNEQANARFKQENEHKQEMQRIKNEFEVEKKEADTRGVFAQAALTEANNKGELIKVDLAKVANEGKALEYKSNYSCSNS